MKKNQRGITLIALIITIIIMLILAGISLGALTANNSIIGNSNKAKTETSISEEKQVLNLSVVQSMGKDKKAIIKESNLSDALENLLGDKSKLTLEGTNNFIVTFNESNRKYIVYNSGETDEYVDMDFLQVGDYVNYTYDDANTYSMTTNSDDISNYDVGYAQNIPQTKNLKWKIFSVNKFDGTVDIISETSTNGIVRLRSSLGYINGVRVLHDICKKQYSNSELKLEARSIRFEDIYDKMNSDGKEYIDSINNTVFTCSGHWYPTLYKYEKGGAIDTDKISTKGLGRSESKKETIESWWSSAKTTLKVSVNCYSKEDLTPFFDNQIVHDLIFAENNYYWIASRYVVPYNDSNVMFGMLTMGLHRFTNAGGLAYSNKYFQVDVGDRKLKPIVTIPNKMLNNKCTKDENGVWQLKINN